MKVFALTGPGYDDCGERIPVEVDLIENGMFCHPFSDNPSRSLFNKIC